MKVSVGQEKENFFEKTYREKIEYRYSDYNSSIKIETDSFPIDYDKEDYSGQQPKYFPSRDSVISKSSDRVIESRNS